MGYSVPDPDYRRESSDPCGQKPGIFHGMYADRRDPQYDPGSFVHLRISSGDQGSGMGNRDRAGDIGIAGHPIFLQVP